METGAAAALAIGFVGLGATLGQGRAAAAALEGAARQPGAMMPLRGMMILGLSMIESVVVVVMALLVTKL
jgi:F-type H+-transporting ATPase subunit c